MIDYRKFINNVTRLHNRKSYLIAVNHGDRQKNWVEWLISDHILTATLKKIHAYYCTMSFTIGNTLWSLKCKITCIKLRKILKRLATLNRNVSIQNTFIQNTERRFMMRCLSTFASKLSEKLHIVRLMVYEDFYF